MNFSMHFLLPEQNRETCLLRFQGHQLYLFVLGFCTLEPEELAIAMCRLNASLLMEISGLSKHLKSQFGLHVSDVTFLDQRRSVGTPC